MPVLMRECPRCLKNKLDTEFKIYSRGRRINCESCDAEVCSNVTADECNRTIDLTNDLTRKMWYRAKAHAKVIGVEFNIDGKDIPTPTRCKYLGIELEYSPLKVKSTKLRQNTASLDRIDSSKGYILGNIQVISALANRMKQDATIVQLLAFAEGVLRVHGG